MTFQSRTLPSPLWRNTAPFLYHAPMELSLDIIYDSEPEQAAAHVLAYFRQEFAKPLPPPKSLLRDEKALMEQIDAAFDGVTLEDGIGLMTTQLLDMYAPREVCAAVAPCEERSDWRRHHARHGPGMLGRPDFYRSQGIPLSPARMADAGPPRPAWRF